MKLKQIIVFLIVVVFCMPSIFYAETVTETEPNNNIDTANKISFSKPINGTVESEGVDCFELELSEPGMINIEFKHPVQKNSNDWVMQIISAENTTPPIMKKRIYGGNITTHIQEFLSSGTYYIKISATYQYYLNYSMEVSFESGKHFERSPNNSMQTATEMSFDNKYTGNLGHRNDVDYFQFSLNEKGNIKVNFSRPKQHHSKNVCQVKIISRENTSPALHSKKIPGKVLETSFQEGLPAGDYYCKVINYNKYVHKKYGIKISHNASEYFESSPNESINTADKVELDKIYSGNLARQKDVDYYQLDLEKPGNLKLQFNLEKHLKKINYWTIDLISKQNKNNVLRTMKVRGGDNFKSVFQEGLSAGTYFVKISRSKGYSGSQYGLKFSHNASEYFESSPNESINTADKVELGKNYRGNLGEKDDVDYYKVDLEEPGNLKLQFDHENQLKKNNYWTIDLISKEENKEAVLRTKTVWGQHLKNKIQEGLSAGTYFVKISNRITRYSKNPYDLKLSHNASDRFEKTPNNSITKSRKIELDQIYHGNLAKQYGKQDVDCFKFTIDEHINAYLRFEHENIKKGQNIKALVYDKTGNKIDEFLLYGKKLKQQHKIGKLVPGKYYLKLKNWHYHNQDPFDFQYKFELSGNYCAFYDQLRLYGDCFPVKKNSQGKMQVAPDGKITLGDALMILKLLNGEQISLE